METAEVIRRATLFIGIDSAPPIWPTPSARQGLCCSVPTWVWTITCRSVVAMRWQHRRLLRAAGTVANLPVATVMTAVRRRLLAVAGAEVGHEV